jgi:hypothetical protein
MKTMNYRTRRIISVVFTVGVLTSVVCVGQDVPQGVNYKKATADINVKAKDALEQALSDNNIPTTFLSEVVMCGPILWNDLKVNNESLSKETTPLTLFISIPEPIKAEGRIFQTQEQRDKFWKAVMDQFPELRKGVVRPATANEIKFYWAQIPFDIEEPLFAIETPNGVFIVNLIMKKDTAVLFWIDRVDDLRKLKK